MDINLAGYLPRINKYPDDPLSVTHKIPECQFSAAAHFTQQSWHYRLHIIQNYTANMLKFGSIHE